MDPESGQRNFLQKHKFTVISLLIIILAAIPLLLLSNTSRQKKSSQSVSQITPSPTATPLTTQNVDPTLSQTDTDMQTTLNQMDSDIKAVGQIDASQDSTSGL
ncbi:MAG TPA: hypothetical protein VLB73_03870 [Patescibacteria group bacterium]|nr:hypothetical protein [Patescibacteria group bacterium]